MGESGDNVQLARSAQSAQDSISPQGLIAALRAYLSFHANVLGSRRHALRHLFDAHYSIADWRATSSMSIADSILEGVRGMQDFAGVAARAHRLGQSGDDLPLYRHPPRATPSAHRQPRSRPILAAGVLADRPAGAALLIDGRADCMRRRPGSRGRQECRRRARRASGRADSCCRTSRHRSSINRDWETGMASSIRAGIARLPGTVDGVLILLVDQPAITADDLRRLVSAWRRQSEYIAAAQYGSTTGAPAIFPQWCFRELAELHGDRGAGALLQRHAERVVPGAQGPRHRTSIRRGPSAARQTAIRNQDAKSGNGYPDRPGLGWRRCLAVAPHADVRLLLVAGETLRSRTGANSIRQSSLRPRAWSPAGRCRS